MTRAGAAKLIGLNVIVDSLGIGAAADITIYTRDQPDQRSHVCEAGLRI